MWTKSFNLEVILICFLSLIPWPAPSVFKISCSRDSARVVRKIVQSRWLPILDKYQVKLPLECPFHPLREIFAPQQAAKTQNRRNQWTCNLCGKSFFEEKYLNMHFDARHNTIINSAEDAVCLANYCDIMRCKVLLSKVATLAFGEPTISTDIELWSETTAYRTDLSASGPRSLAKLPNSHFLPSILRDDDSEHIDENCNTQNADDCQRFCDNSNACDNENGAKDAASDICSSKSRKLNAKVKHDGNEDPEESDCNATSSSEESTVDSSLPPVDKKQQRITEFQRMKANCKPDELEQLKLKCEILVRDCIAGLLIQLSNEDFKAMEDELNRAVCWYLTCDRYFEDGPIEQRAFPWGLVFILILLLSFGVCFPYYIIWILFDTDDHLSPPPTMPSSSYLQSGGQMSPTHHVHNQQAYHQSHYSSGTITPLMHTTHPQTHLIGNSSASMSNIPVSVSVNPMPTSRSTTPASGYPEEFYAANDFNEMGQSEHYIYVTYPPELKRRLLESCYNRTTRL